MRTCIVIPSYKAEKTLGPTIDRIPPSVLENGGMVVVVNDASPDRTGEVAEALARERPFVRVVHHDVNKGYGGAQKTGLRHGLEHGCEAFAVVHSDGQYAPEKLPELLEPIRSGRALIVQGSRFLAGGALQGGMPLHRYVANIALTTLENLAFGTRMAEFHSGYMLYSRRLLLEVPFEKLQNNYNFDAEMILLAHLAGHRCAEVPIPTRYDHETSSLDPIPYGLNVLRMIARHLRGHYKYLLEQGRAADSQLRLQ